MQLDAAAVAVSIVGRRCAETITQVAQAISHADLRRMHRSKAVNEPDVAAP
jgi:hypothetical protein